MTRILMSVGEASGDMHAADLVRALQRQQPSVELFGMGGPLMRDAGVDLLFNPTSMSTVGFVEALRSVHVLRRVLDRIADAIEERRPDVIVCVDFPGFNLKLAEIAHRRGIPCVYYLSPSVWAWGRGRADRLKRLGVKVCAVFPFEEAVFRDIGAAVEFIGHPLLDRVRPEHARADVRAELGIAADERLVALMPGSRGQELKLLLAPMLQAAALVHEQRPETKFVVPVAHTLTAQNIKAHLPVEGALPLAVVEGRTYDMLNAADAGLLSMGTATLEAALLGVPHVACYRVSGPTYVVAKSLLKVEHLALPNIIAERRIVPELTQSDVTGKKLAEALLPMLDEQRHAALQAELAQVRQALGEPGAAERAAAIILAEAQRSEQDES